jgi:hypothetical protein
VVVAFALPDGVIEAGVDEGPVPEGPVPVGYPDSEPDVSVQFSLCPGKPAPELCGHWCDQWLAVPVGHPVGQPVAVPLPVRGAEWVWMAVVPFSVQEVVYVVKLVSVGEDDVGLVVGEELFESPALPQSPEEASQLEPQ